MGLVYHSWLFLDYQHSRLEDGLEEPKDYLE
jgi:hypothetical protein